jgi:acetyl esterase/lipase
MRLFIISFISVIVFSLAAYWISNYSSASSFIDISEFPAYGHEFRSEDSEHLSFLRYWVEEDKIKGYFFRDEGRTLVEKVDFVLRKQSDFSYKGTIGNVEVDLGFTGIINEQEIKGKLAVKRMLFDFIPLGYRRYKVHYIGDKRVEFPESKRYHYIDSKVNIQKDIQYGSARGYYTSKSFSKLDYTDVAREVLKSTIFKEELDLKIDVYQPEKDSASKHPLLVLVHGGAFILGDKEEETIVALANMMAQRGFVVASVNYRLGFKAMPNLEALINQIDILDHLDLKLGTPSSLERSIYRSTQDVRAALRFMVHHQEEYNIDPNFIFLAGSSAGGFITLNVAFMKEEERYKSTHSLLAGLIDDLGCLDCSSNDYKDAFKLRGIINMWGALTDISIMDQDEKIPMLSIHGTADEIVPIGHDYCFNDLNEYNRYFYHKVYGSQAIHGKAAEYGFSEELVLIQEGKHVPHINKLGDFNKHIEVIRNSVRNFLIVNIQPAKIKIDGARLIEDLPGKTAYRIEAEEGATYNWLVAGGKVITKRPFTNQVEVIWFKNADRRFIIAKKMNAVGIIERDHVEVAINK